MPEILTKHPDIVLTLLKNVGAKCNAGIQPQILTQCPSDHFCSLPHGELCVYGIKDISKMTQIVPNDLSNVLSSIPSIYSNFNIILLIISFIMGIGIGWLLKKNKIL